jgi:hypothetical protein
MTTLADQTNIKMISGEVLAALATHQIRLSRPAQAVNSLRTPIASYPAACRIEARGENLGRSVSQP